uniref:PDZ domain-containing protein n=1 Tax=Elaeophora elaphi TaxID=1147741 RepID=A0A0R3RXL3_9BILA
MFCVVQGIGERSTGIYVKKVVDGSAAHRDGRLESGDQLLSVNGQSLTGISQEEAASKMSSSGPIVSFEVYKHAARYNGLYEWLNNPPQSQVPSSGIHSVIQTGQLRSSGQQSTVPNSAENVAVNAAANVQRFSRQNSATSMTSNYSSNAHFNLMKPARNGCPGAMINNAYRIWPQRGSITVTDHQPIKSRSASTSDIYKNPIDKTLTVSLTSLQPSSAVSTVPAHSEKYQTTVASSQRTTSPHYRNIRPIVIQPSRPAPSPTLRQQQHYHSRSHSPSHLYANSSLSSSNHYHNSVLKNALSSEHVLSSTSSSPITDYANLPVIEDHHSTFESSYSSTSSRNIPHQRLFPHNSTQQQFEASRNTNTNPVLRDLNSVASTSSHDSTRSSVFAPIQELGVVMDECSRRRFMKKAPPVPPKRHITRRDELNQQLDELESKGSAMTDADHQKYRELVNELAKIHVPFSVESDSNKNIVERKQSKSLSPEIVICNRQNDSCFERPKNLLISEKCETTSLKLELNEAEEIAEKQKQNTAVTKVEEFLEEKKDALLTVENSDETIMKEKEVQWDDIAAENLGRKDSGSDNKLIYEDDDQQEPRTQVLGTHEVYRDPRQARLIELEAKQHAAQEARIDGSKLGFRDKMQLFAEQIGEKALKNRYKASTIQREIEQTLDDF